MLLVQEGMNVQVARLLPHDFMEKVHEKSMETDDIWFTNSQINFCTFCGLSSVIYKILIEKLGYRK